MRERRRISDLVRCWALARVVQSSEGQGHLVQERQGPIASLKGGHMSGRLVRETGGGKEIWGLGGRAEEAG